MTGMRFRCAKGSDCRLSEEKNPCLQKSNFWEWSYSIRPSGWWFYLCVDVKGLLSAMGCYNAEDWRLFVGSLNASLIWVLLQWRQVVCICDNWSFCPATPMKPMKICKLCWKSWNATSTNRPNDRKKFLFVTKLYMIKYFIRFFLNVY